MVESQDESMLHSQDGSSPRELLDPQHILHDQGIDFYVIGESFWTHRTSCMTKE